MLSPGEEARVATSLMMFRRMLSRMVANYLMIRLWGQGVQWVGMTRLSAFTL